MRLFVRLSSRQLQRAILPEITTKTHKQRSLRIAIIGTPNVGKSALTNQLIKAELCAVSKLIDTTRQASFLGSLITCAFIGDTRIFFKPFVKNFLTRLSKKNGFSMWLPDCHLS